MPVPVRFEGSVFSRSLRRRGLPSGVVASFGQPFQPAVPVIPPAGRTLVPVPLHSEFHAPNHALQRTEAGGRVSLAIHVLRRQPLSLSLGPLGALLLCSVGGGHAGSRSLRGRRLFPFAPWSRFAFPGRRQLRSALPGGSAPHSPAGGRSVLPSSRTANSTGLTRRSSERRLAVGLSLYSISCVASLRR